MTPDQAGRLSLAEQHDWYRRRAAVRPGTAAAPGRRPEAGTAIPASGRHLAFGADPARQMSVAWQVPALVSDPFLRVGESPGDLSQRVAAEIRAVTTRRRDTRPVHPAPPSAGPVIEQYYVHAAVSGLRPGRRYYYAIGHRGLDPGPAGPGGVFRTAPAGREPFTFTAFGDQGVSYDAAAAAALVRAQDPAFHLHAGDISYAESGGRGLITDGYDPRIWDSFFALIEQAAGQIPWQIAVGNHEMEAWHSADGYGGQRARFAFTGGSAAGPPPVYYSFVYGNVGVVSLDANDVSAEITANHGYTGGAQTSWLAASLAALRSRPDVDFIVVFFHHCAYCTCSAHGSDGGVREAWVPLFDRHHVDLVINGHNHVYERTDPLAGGRCGAAAPPGATVRPAADGTTYITAGGGGMNLYGFPAADSYPGRGPGAVTVRGYVHAGGGETAGEPAGWSRVRYTGYCLLVADSRPGPLAGGGATLVVRALAEDGTEIDRVTLVR